MLYLIALFLPPLAIALAGRWFVGIITFFIWLPAVLISGGLGHPIFVLLAFFLVHQSSVERTAARRW